MESNNNKTTAVQETTLTTLSPQEIILKLSKDPDFLKNYIKDINTQLESSKQKSEEIKNRGFFKNLFSSNTKDIAAELLEQNDTMVKFFQLLQVLTFACKGNSTLLLGLIDSLKQGMEVSDAENGNIYNFAKAYFEQALDNAKSVELRELALKKVLSNVIALNQFQKKTEETFKKIIDQCEEQVNERLLFFEQANDSDHKTIKQELLNTSKDLAELFSSQISSLETLFNDRFKSIDSEIELLKKKNFFDTTLYKALLGIVSFSALILSLFSVL